MCNGDFSVLPLVSSVKYQSKRPKSLLVGGQCFERVVMSETIDSDDFNL